MSNSNLNDKYHNAITNHLTNSNSDTSPHFIKWDDFDILDIEPSLNKRLLSEMFFIKKEGENIV